ncbi:DUF1737 domain-containing protein [Psychromarinibacter sp. C21-152]|uniref:DUF1737 domain-containing protein n=1 Tax=Psychromarinibacter sediminicola TaxID=3033385 RepID=A0AAE3NQV2_9RHOB|nr:DUF1737 domain-containing protein [Psychromarinibacter sediminicola]MDF0600401.1 DUF1737 domain-containing protein [Psychromarinibacter sediminicola]
MAKISDYMVVWTVYRAEREENAEYDRLATMVRQRIAEGWQPHGSMSMLVKGDQLLVAQPMVREEG